MKEESKSVIDIPQREVRKKLKQQEIIDTVNNLPRVNKVKEEPVVPRINKVKQIKKGRPTKYNVFKKI